MIKAGDIEISIPRLLLAAIKSNKEININLLDYLDENLDEYKMMLAFDDELNQFILTIEEKENDGTK